MDRASSAGSSQRAKNVPEVHIPASSLQSNEQYLLGQNYEKGEGGYEKDMKKAIDHYYEAAVNGHENARIRLVYIVFSQALTENARYAEQRFHAATNNEYNRAIGQFLLQLRHSKKIEVLYCLGMLMSVQAEDSTKAEGLKLLTFCADQGDDFAQLQVAIIKIRKKDDMAGALRYLDLSVAQGNTQALYHRAFKYIEAQDAQAFQYLERAANDGHLISQFTLETAYRNGWGVEINNEKADHYQQRRAGQELDEQTKSYIPRMLWQYFCQKGLPHSCFSYPPNNHHSGAAFKD
jgi:TPR repeat protein